MSIKDNLRIGCGFENCDWQGDSYCRDHGGPDSYRHATKLKLQLYYVQNKTHTQTDKQTE